MYVCLPHRDHNDQFAVFLGLKTLSLVLALTLACLNPKISNLTLISLTLIPLTLIQPMNLVKAQSSCKI